MCICFVIITVKCHLCYWWSCDCCQFVKTPRSKHELHFNFKSQNPSAVFINLHCCQQNKAEGMMRRYFLCHSFIILSSRCSCFHSFLFIFSSWHRCHSHLATRLESLITDLLCFSHPCSAVFIVYFEPLWPSEPHRPLCSQHHLFSKTSLSFTLPPPPRHCPGHSCPGAYLLVVHVPRVLIETACSCSTDILSYDIYGIGRKWMNHIITLLISPGYWRGIEEDAVYYMS